MRLVCLVCDVNFDPLVNVQSAKFLRYKVTIFSHCN